jgi:carbonic anhydrase
MSEIEALLEANRLYVAAHSVVANTRPSRHLAVVTCMDARIDVFAALGLHLGEAHVIRNAGGRVTDDVLRSLTLSSHELGVDTVVVMQHTKCGLTGITDAELQARTGADFSFLPIADHAAALHHDLDLLAEAEFLVPLQRLAGLLFDVDTGAVDELVRWERPA